VAEGAQDYLVKGEISARLLVRTVRYAIERQQYATRARLLAEERAARVAAEALASENARLHLEAQRAIEARDEFLAIASHELKTPIMTLCLQLQAARHTAQGVAAAKLTGNIDSALRVSKRLASLTETLLDVSRITAGRFTLYREDFDASAVTRDVIGQLREDAMHAGCEVTLRANAPVNGHWDKVAVAQTVTNLLSNAIKYGRGTPIDISVQGEHPDLVITVSDQGPGIPESDLPRIFGRFERAATTRHYRTGLGLGLYVAREIALAHGGTLDAENLPERGARFTLRLPLRGSR
jgi:hypothetical protein